MWLASPAPVGSLDDERTTAPSPIRSVPTSGPLPCFRRLPPVENHLNLRLAPHQLDQLVIHARPVLTHDQHRLAIRGEIIGTTPADGRGRLRSVRGFFCACVLRQRIDRRSFHLRIVRGAPRSQVRPTPDTSSLHRILLRRGTGPAVPDNPPDEFAQEHSAKFVPEHTSRSKLNRTPGTSTMRPLEVQLEVQEVPDPQNGHDKCGIVGIRGNPRPGSRGGIPNTPNVPLFSQDALCGSRALNAQRETAAIDIPWAPSGLSPTMDSGDGPSRRATSGTSPPAVCPEAPGPPRGWAGGPPPLAGSSPPWFGKPEGRSCPPLVRCKG